MLLEAKVDQRVQAFVDLGDDIAAVAAIATVRAAARNIFLTPKADAARPAVPSFNVDFGLIEKLHFFWDLPESKRGRCAVPFS